jgi:hypothetical protein
MRREVLDTAVLPNGYTTTAGQIADSRVPASDPLIRVASQKVVYGVTNFLSFWWNL